MHLSFTTFNGSLWVDVICSLSFAINVLFIWTICCCVKSHVITTCTCGFRQLLCQLFSQLLTEVRHPLLWCHLHSWPFYIDRPVSRVRGLILCSEDMPASTFTTFKSHTEHVSVAGAAKFRISLKPISVSPAPRSITRSSTYCSHFAPVNFLHALNAPLSLLQFPPAPLRFPIRSWWRHCMSVSVKNKSTEVMLKLVDFSSVIGYKIL